MRHEHSLLIQDGYCEKEETLSQRALDLDPTVRLEFPARAIRVAEQELGAVDVELDPFLALLCGRARRRGRWDCRLGDGRGCT